MVQRDAVDELRTRLDHSGSVLRASRSASPSPCVPLPGSSSRRTVVRCAPSTDAGRRPLRWLRAGMRRGPCSPALPRHSGWACGWGSRRSSCRSGSRRRSYVCARGLMKVVDSRRRCSPSAAAAFLFLPAAYAPSDQDDRPARGSHAPGTHWFYNNWDFNVSGVIIERLTGETVYEVFGPPHCRAHRHGRLRCGGRPPRL